MGDGTEGRKEVGARVLRLKPKEADEAPEQEGGFRVAAYFRYLVTLEAATDRRTARSRAPAPCA